MFGIIGFWLHVRAFISDFALISIALGCLAGAFALLLVNPANMDQWPIIGGLASGVKRAVAYVLIGVSVALLAFYAGERSGGALERQIAEQKLEAIRQANEKAILDAQKEEQTKAAKNAESLRAQIDALSTEKQSSDDQIASQRKRIAELEGADPKAAAEKASPLVLEAIKGSRK
jgi:hypothetical protein